MGMSPLAGLFGAQETEKRQNDNKYYGAVLAVVTNNKHGPEGPTYGTGSIANDDYRVRVQYPWLPGSDQSYWARMGTFMASKSAKGVGAYWLPEIGDEV